MKIGRKLILVFLFSLILIGSVFAINLDVNQDEKLGVADAVKINIIAKKINDEKRMPTQSELEQADINKDGWINSKDTEYLLKLIHGQIGVKLGEPISSSLNDKFSDGVGTLTIDKNSPTIETSLTSAEDDYQTNVVMEVQRDSIRYTLINPGNLIKATFDNPIMLNILGQKMKISKVLSDTSLMNYGGEIRDGDAFIGEDLDDPNWVWNLDNLMSDNPIVGIENDFIWNDDSDNPAGIGECIYLPSNYAQICFDNLNVKDNEYDTYTIELDKNTDLSDAGAGTNVPTVYLHTSSADGFDLTAKSLVEKGLTNGGKTNKVWLKLEGNNKVSIYYEETNTNKIRKAGIIDLNKFSYANFASLNTKWMGMETPYFWISKSGNKYVVSFAGEIDKIDSYWKTDGSNFVSLGDQISQEESNELVWSYKAKEFTNIGTKDEDHRSAYGVIIRDPKAHGSSDEVVLDIPRKEVSAKVSVKFN